MKGAFLGPAFSDKEIERFLASAGAVYGKLSLAALIDRTAALLAEQKVVGWLQGRMEFRPARSATTASSATHARPRCSR